MKEDFVLNEVITTGTFDEINSTFVDMVYSGDYGVVHEHLTFEDGRPVVHIKHAAPKDSEPVFIFESRKYNPDSDSNWATKYGDSRLIRQTTMVSASELPIETHES